MKLDVWVATVVLVSAIFFVIGYALNIGRASEISPKFIYIDVIYFFGYFFFLLYAILNFYQAVKYPREDLSFSLSKLFKGLFGSAVEPI